MTIKEIAKLAGVSITSVSFFLNNKEEKLSKKTAAKLKKIIKETGYKPNTSARELRLQVTNKIAIVVFDLEQYFAQQIYKSIAKGLANENVIISLYESHLDFEKEKRHVVSLIESKVKAIIMQPSKKMLEYLPTIYKKYSKTKSKIILIDSKGQNIDFGYVYSDSSTAIESLLKQNKKNNIEEIIYVSGKIEKLQVRELRYSQLENLSKSLGMKFKCLITEDGAIKKDDFETLLEEAKGSKKAFWTNSANLAFNLYAQLEKNNEVNNNTIVSFNECFFKHFVKLPLLSINTKIEEVGLEVARQIKNNRIERIQIEAEINVI